MYHDVVDPGFENTTGTPGRHSARYKLNWDTFLRHLAALDAVCQRGPALAGAFDNLASAGLPLLLTFDDGGASALRVGTFLVERYNWRAHFFVVTGWVGRPGFLSEDHIRELRALGHVVGSHSHSHPRRIDRLPAQAIRDEWASSLGLLSEILGEQPTVASVPGGFYSREVAALAATAGVTHLFTSEPISEVVTVQGCRVFGRFPVLRNTSSAEVAGLFTGARTPHVKRRVVWSSKKLLKRLPGDLAPNLWRDVREFWTGT